MLGGKHEFDCGIALGHVGAKFFNERREILVQINSGQIAASIKVLVNLPNSFNSVLRRGKRIFRRNFFSLMRLHRNEALYHLKRVGDAMVHFSNKHFEAFVGFTEVRFGFTLLAFEAISEECLPKAAVEQIEKAITDSFHYKV